MLLAVPLKLTLTTEEKASLLKTMYIVNSACDFISQYAFEHKLFNQFRLHKALYLTVRKRFSLSAQFAVRALAKVANSYNADKQSLHQFKTCSAIEYDVRLLNFGNLETVSMLTVDGRLKKVPIVIPPYANVTRKHLRNSATLVYRNKQFYLQALAEADEQPLITNPSDIFGVDVGITNIATTSYGKVYSGEQADTVRIRYTKLKSNLQAAGTKSAKKHLQKLSRKERLFKRNLNHIISKLIVSEAKRHNAVIVLEDLKHLRVTVSKAQRQRFGRWAFGELATFIEYKAKLAGVPVVKVNPAYTSQSCSQCGHRERGNRNGEVFVCKHCGYECNADLNASYNIAAEGKMYIQIVNVVSELITMAAVNQPIVAIEKHNPVSIHNRVSDKLESKA